MARNKGPNSTRRKCNPRYNSLSRAQCIRRAKEKEALLKLYNELQVIDESLQDCNEDVHGINALPISKTEILKHSEESSKLPDYSPSTTVVNYVPVTKTGILGTPKQNLKKLLLRSIYGNKSSGIANRCRPISGPTPEAKVQPSRRAKEKAVWKLYSKQITNESFQDCSQRVTSIDSVSAGSGEILNASEENSNSPDYSPDTIVVNSVPVTKTAILGPSKQNVKKHSMHGICRNKSSGIANRCRPKSYPTRRSKAARLRRAKEKEALMKLCGEQIIHESLQDYSQEVTSIDSVPTRSKNILNPSERNEKNSDFSQNLTIIDSVSVIKTEILDESETNHGLIFQDYSQYATTMCTTMPVIKTEILEISSTNQNLVHRNIKGEQTQINNAMNETSRTEGLFKSIMNNNKNYLKIEKDDLEKYPKVHLLPKSESPFLPHLSGSYKKSQSPKKKKKLDFNRTVHRNKGIKKKVRPHLSKTVCGCFKKIALRKRMCENYLQVVQQDDANQLCLCKAGNHTLPETMKPNEKVMKKFCLVYPDFGKITCNINSRLG